MPKPTRDHDVIDCSQIKIDEEHDVAYWTERFGVTSRELAWLVRECGTSVEAIEEALKQTV